MSALPPRRYVVLVAVTSVALLTVFAIAEALAIGVLSDPAATLERGGVAIAGLAVGLLAADAVLPVPASIVMFSVGAVYGPVLGVGLSTVGTLLAAAIAFALGRAAGDHLERLIPDDQRSVVAAWFLHRGDVAVILTRPLPILAETTAALAGTTPMPGRRFALAALAGCLPVALAYSLAGAAVADLDAWWLVLPAAVAVSLPFWVASNVLARRPPTMPEPVSAG